MGFAHRITGNIGVPAVGKDGPNNYGVPASRSSRPNNYGANLIGGEGGANLASEGGASAASDADVEAVLKAYDLMSRGLYTHATPTLFNAGAVRPQLCSCFLLTAKADSIDGIFETLKQCAHASPHCTLLSCNATL